MSASRRLRRQQAREAAKSQPRVTGVGDPNQSGIARLRRRVRYVLLATTLIGLVFLRVFHEPVARALLQYGLAARIALVLVLLSPALFTWMIGLGELRDQARDASV